MQVERNMGHPCFDSTPLLLNQDLNNRKNLNVLHDRMCHITHSQLHFTIASLYTKLEGGNNMDIMSFGIPFFFFESKVDYAGC